MSAARRDALPPVLKRLGQHFLTDRGALERVANALKLTGSETVIEVGPGRGALTDLLADRAKRVIAIEIDRGLVPVLRERYAARAHVQIVEADVLRVNLGELVGGEFVLIGNVPYYITTPILFHALSRPRPTRAVYLVQREVAERIAASPGSKIYGALSVNIQAVARAELVSSVAARAFSPPPSVESAIVRITPREDPVIQAADEDAYRAFVIGAFAQRRKQMKRVLRSLAPLSAEQSETLLSRLGIDPTRRPETLTPAEFAVILGATREAR